MDEVSEVRDGDESEEEERAEGEDEWLSFSQRRFVADSIRSTTDERHAEKAQKRTHAQRNAHPLLRDAGFEQKRRNVSEAGRGAELEAADDRIEDDESERGILKFRWPSIQFH